MSTLDFIKQIKAQQNFKIIDDFKVTGIEEVREEAEEFPDQLELFAVVKIKFSGQLPDSYRVLNAIIADWVESHVEELDQKIHPVLVEYFESNYPNSDLSNIEKGFEETPIWTDQVDYMPRTKEESDEMIIEVEMVLEPEIIEEE